MHVDMYNKSVLVDFKNEVGEFQTGLTINGKRTATRSFAVWQSIKQRATSGSNFQKRFPWYEGTTIAEEWKESFQKFALWYTSQIGYEYGWDIDKDFLSDSRQYGPKTCILLPREVNLLFSNRNQSLNIIDATKLDMIPRWRTQDAQFFTDYKLAVNHAVDIRINKIKSLQNKYKDLIPAEVFQKLVWLETLKMHIESAADSNLQNTPQSSQTIS